MNCTIVLAEISEKPLRLYCIKKKGRFLKIVQQFNLKFSFCFIKQNMIVKLDKLVDKKMGVTTVDKQIINSAAAFLEGYK